MTDIVIVDTNILVRYALNDNHEQALIAHNYINNIKYQCVIPIQVFCELDWVLRKREKIPRNDVVLFFMDLINRPNISFDNTEFEKGLYFLKNGGDFADGVIAYQTTHFDNAKWLTFDKDGRKLAKRVGIGLEIE